ncbi:XRE family transcriptional regulator, partial [Sulfolobus sp. B5]
ERNTETWNLVVTNKKVLDDFNEKFKINPIQVKKVGINDILGNRLTEKEMNVLRTAMMMGYLDYPRKVKAKDVAEVLGISKQDFLYHLRNALNKIVLSSF